MDNEMQVILASIRERDLKIYLKEFIKESNKIEGIHRETSATELRMTMDFVLSESLNVEDLMILLSCYQRDAVLRNREGINVRVGNHIPILGGSEVQTKLLQILVMANNCSSIKDAFTIHQLYEDLHPFTDGNGRTGRALWLHCYYKVTGLTPPCLFLQMWYYNSLEFWRSKE